MNKQKCYAWLIGLAAAATTTACHEDIGFNSSSAVGKIVPRVELNTSIVSSKKSAARAAADITVNDLALKITSDDGSYSGSWTSLSEYPSDNSFPIGDYLVEALYGSVENEGFDCPAYYGSQKITVLEDETTDVNLTASLANTMLSVDYSDAFKKYMTTWSAEAHSTGGEYIYFDKDESRPAYMRPGTITLSVEFTKPNGTSAKLQVAQFEGQACHHYYMTVDLNEGAAGDVVLTVIYDDALETENIEIDLSDELMNAPAPEITGVGVVNGSLISLMEGDAIAQSIKTNIKAQGSLAAVILTTQSTDLIAKGWPAEIDLISATSAQQATIQNLGLNVLGLWKNPDKMAVIDFTDVLKNTYNATFLLQVRDKYGKVSEVFSFNVKVEELKLEYVSTEKFAYGADELTFRVKYNGSNANDIKVKSLNSLGVFGDATVKSVVATGEAGVYDVTFATSATASSVEFYAYAATKQTETVTVNRADAPVSLACDDADVWATKATVTGTINDADEASPLQLVYRKEGASDWSNLDATISGSDITANLSSLSDNTTYEVAAYSNSNLISKIVSFTTEAATQLPNSDMETEPTISVSGSNYECYVYTDGWGTNNPMTTSQGADYGYCRVSGTIPTTDVHGGSNATLIRTMGWGSGNSALSGVNGACKYIDPGLYHIGDSRSARPSGYSDRSGVITTDDLTTGMSFASRPTSMSLWYKYTAKNSNDHGVAEIYVYDASGNIIGSGSAELTAASAYTQKTIALNYTSNAGKAAKIYVKFLSTYDQSFLVKNSSYISGPGWGNLSRGTYMGSQLYLDDLSLNY